MFCCSTLNMEVGLGSEGVLLFECAVMDSSEREICQCTLLSFYWNQKGLSISTPVMLSILYRLTLNMFWQKEVQCSNFDHTVTALP